jgi:hypothetical protein
MFQLLVILTLSQPQLDSAKCLERHLQVEIEDAEEVLAKLEATLREAKTYWPLLRGVPNGVGHIFQKTGVQVWEYCVDYNGKHVLDARGRVLKRNFWTQNVCDGNNYYCR